MHTEANRRTENQKKQNRRIYKPQKKERKCKYHHQKGPTDRQIDRQTSRQKTPKEHENPKATKGREEIQIKS